MQTTTNRLVLMLMAVALLVSPMRSGWAMPAADTDDTVPHCAQMQDDAADSLAETDSDSPSPAKCNGCCDGDCINMDCNACAQVATAISVIYTLSPVVSASQPNTTQVVTYPERTVIPPLRPPTSL